MRVQGQPKLRSENLFQKTKNKKDGCAKIDGLVILKLGDYPELSVLKFYLCGVIW
jgi:hypothetical protein